MSRLHQNVTDEISSKELYEAGLEMNKAYIELQESLQDFNEDRIAYQSTLDEKEEEQINSVRVIKKEVIDLADMMDKMSGILIQNNKNIDESGNIINDIRHILHGQED